MSEQPQEIHNQPDEPIFPQIEAQSQELFAQQPPKTNRRKLLIIGGAILAIIILAGSLMNNRNKAANNPGNDQVLQSNGAGPNGQVVSKQINQSQITPAPGLPTIQADVHGVFLSRTNDSFTIGSGQIQIGIQKNSSGAVTPNVNYNGPIYDVVVTKNTVIYKDTTAMDPGNTGPIQQTVAPGTLDDLNTTTVVSVWGAKSGNRYVATTILYTQPMSKLPGGGGGTLK